MARTSCREFARLSRRQMLVGCGASVLGLSLAELLALRSEAGPLALRSEAGPRRGREGFGRAKSCIVLYCWGGVSHIDTWDPKPDAPAEVRGEFKPIATSVPGIRLTDVMPLLARQMKRIALVRSIHHSSSAHGKGMYWNP